LRYEDYVAAGSFAPICFFATLAGIMAESCWIHEEKALPSVDPKQRFIAEYILAFIL